MNPIGGFIPAFHRDLVIGVATYALELFRSAGELDAVYVGVGMGSGISGLIAVRNLLRLKTEIVGAGAVSLAALLQERERMKNKNVAVILSGGNIERARYLQVPGGNTPVAA